MMEKIKKNKFLLFVVLIYLILLLSNTEKAIISFKNSGYYIKEMLMIMPVIFVLTALIEAWVPKKMIMEHLGDGSGLKGSFISLLLGSVSAGPIYAAFPVCKTLLKKGASISNIVVILSAWAVIKIPMLANEAKFLSPKFMATRWVLTTIAILIMGYLISKIVRRKDIPMDSEKINDGEIVIKEEYCIGCGICEKLAPNYFKVGNKKAKVVNSKAEQEMEGAIIKAIEKCPTKAIAMGDKKLPREKVGKQTMEMN
ncbi:MULTISPECIES: permease [Bacillota]|uniref:permease n=1 Tax=Bacillota TaxID=1239 RepID=UPI000419A935|nr:MULTISPECIES: permease [Bacillota]MCF6461958.1 permease [Clostridium sp. Cult1]